MKAPWGGVIVFERVKDFNDFGLLPHFCRRRRLAFNLLTEILVYNAAKKTYEGGCDFLPDISEVLVLAINTPDLSAILPSS